MPLNVLGFQTHRDPVATAFEEESLREQVTSFLGSLPSHDEWREYARSCCYRPFDPRKVYLNKAVADRPRLEVTRHLFEPNIALNLVRQTKAKQWRHALVSDKPTPAVFLEIKDGSSIFPVYLYPFREEEKHRQTKLGVESSPWSGGLNGRRPNLNPKFVADLEKRLGLSFVSDGKGNLKNTFGPEDVFNYMYAVFYSPAYRTRYAEFLKSHFPRVPLTSDVKLFRSLCGLGAELVALHLLESPGLAKPIARYPVKGTNLVDKGFPKYVAPGELEPGTGKPLKDGRVYINKEQRFEGVPPEVWNLQIGGYQVCDRWLKDRRGRTLTYEDLEHYCKVATALKETIRLMAEIDAAIRKWPIE